MEYLITTTGEDLTNFYRNVSEPWEFVAHTDEGRQVWSAATEQPTALEQLLNTDDAVVSYKEA